MIQQYLRWKATLSEDMDLSEALLHVHAGLVIFVLVALVLRKPMRSWIPLAAVIALALLNEVVDYVYSARWDAESSLKDLVNTILWPSLLFLLARRVGR